MKAALRQIAWFIAVLCLPGLPASAASLTFTVNASEPVTVAGTPRLAIDVGGISRYATYAAGSGTSALTFSYAVQPGDFDANGIAMASPLDLNGGTLTDIAGNTATSVAFTLPDTSALKVQTYTASFVTNPITAANASAVSFTIAKAPTGASFSYAITSSGGSGSVTGSGTISGISHTVSNINVSNLALGTLTLSVTVSTAAGGTGAAKTATAELQQTLWTPASILSSLVFWHDADDVNTISMSTGVSTWRDKSGHGKDATQATASNQPSYSQSGFFGRPGVTFDGVNDMLQVSTTGMQNTTHGVYWVFQRRGIGTTPPGDGYSPEIGVLATTTSIDRGALHYVKTSNGRGASYPYYPNPGNYDLSSGTAYNTTAGQVMAFQQNTSGFGVWRNGTLEGTTSALSAADASCYGYTYGAQWLPWRRSNITIAEVIMVDVTSTATREKIEGYLAWKWGLAASLPAGHPYKNSAPVIGN